MHAVAAKPGALPNQLNHSAFSRRTLTAHYLPTYSTHPHTLSCPCHALLFLHPCPVSSLQPRGPLSFLPGQWVDFFIPGLTTVGGFSFTSTPRQLAQRGSFELAVKRSRHAPAAWLHDKVDGWVAGRRAAGQAGGWVSRWAGERLCLRVVKRLKLTGAHNLRPHISLSCLVYS